MENKHHRDTMNHMWFGNTSWRRSLRWCIGNVGRIWQRLCIWFSPDRIPLAWQCWQLRWGWECCSRADWHGSNRWSAVKRWEEENTLVWNSSWWRKRTLIGIVHIIGIYIVSMINDLCINLANFIYRSMRWTKSLSIIDRWVHLKITVMMAEQRRYVRSFITSNGAPSSIDLSEKDISSLWTSILIISGRTGWQ